MRTFYKFDVVDDAKFNRMFEDKALEQTMIVSKDEQLKDIIHFINDEGFIVIPEKEHQEFLKNYKTQIG